MSTEQDAIVVGAGTAGAVVAARLVEAGLRVRIVEAGPDYGALDERRWPGELLDFVSLPTSHDWGYTGTGATGQPLDFGRARVVGGCSSHNGCTQSIGWAGDWDLLAKSAGDDWNASSVRAIALQVAEKMRFRSYTEAEIQPFHAAFLEACAASGVSRADNFIDLDGGESSGVAPVNAVENTRFNTAFAYLDQLRGGGLLQIEAGAHIDRVLFDAEGRATGVTVRDFNGTRELHAGLVVLCAGAYGTPEILLRSGIGPADELTQLGVEVRHELPGVGKNLHDHPTAQLEFSGSQVLREALERFEAPVPEEQSLAKLASPWSDGPYDLHIYPWIEPSDAQPYGWKVVLPVAQLRPRSRGRVTLRPGDTDGIGAIDPAFFSDPAGADLDSVVYGVRWVIDRLLPGSFGDLLDDVIGEDPRGYDDSQLRDWVLRTHTHYWHPAGSCRIGMNDDPMAVVDGSGAVHGLSGLHIADASIFPDIPRSTPAMPTVIAAEIVARALISRDAQPSSRP